MLDQVEQVCLAQEDPWVLAGDSAGGGLALAAAFRLRDAAAPHTQPLRALRAQGGLSGSPGLRSTGGTLALQ
jgi:acetyl esterase/lipase